MTRVKSKADGQAGGREVAAAAVAEDTAGAAATSRKFSVAMCPDAFEPDLVQASMEARVAARILGKDVEEVFARYTIGEALGAGGMGAVYAATDGRLGREVAIKVLKRQGQPRELRRMRREAKSMAAIDHPNAIKVFELGESDGRPYIVMERIHGPTLRQWLREDRRPWAEVLDTMLGAGRALAAVHRRGMQHRDIKPSNLLVDLQRGAVLIDFGLSRLQLFDTPRHGDSSTDDGSTGSAGSVDERITQTGMVVGTPAYMAPESRQDVDSGPAIEQWIDQWTFCLVVWEALFASRPIDLDALQGVPAPKLPWEPALGRVPKFVSSALRRGMQSSPDDRWPDMDALLRALRPRARRRYVAVGLGVALAAAASVLAGGAPTQVDSVQRAQTQLSGLYATGVLALGRSHATSADPHNSVAPLETAFFAATAAGDAAAAAEAAASLSDVYIAELLNSERARYWLNVLEVTIERENLQGLWPARTQAILANILSAEMKPEEALATAVLALRRLPVKPPSAALQGVRESLLTSAAITSQRLGKPTQALEYFQAALDSVEAEPKTGAPHRLRMKFNVVLYTFYLDPNTVTADALAALARDVDAEVGDGVLLRMVRGEAAAAMLEVGRIAEGKAAAERLLASLPEDDPSTQRTRARALLLIGGALWRLDEPEAGIGQLNAALISHQAVYGPDHVMTTNVIGELGHALVSAGRYADAAAAFRRAMEIVREALGADSDPCRSLSLALGDALEQQGQLDAARQIYADIAKTSARESWALFGAKLGELSVAHRSGTPPAKLRERLVVLKAAVVDAGHEEKLAEPLAALEARLAR